MTNIRKIKHQKPPRKHKSFVRVTFFARIPKIKEPGMERVIYARITYSSQQVEFATGIKVPHFAFENGRIRPINDLLVENQRVLDNLSIEVLRIYNDIQANGSIVTPGLIRDQLLMKEGLLKTFVVIFDEFMAGRKKLIGKEVTELTYKRELMRLNNAKSFIRFKFRSPDICIEKINVEFAEGLLTYLKSEKNLSNDYAVKTIELIKRVIDYAISRGYFKSGNALKAAKFKRHNKAKLCFLSVDQVKKLQETHFDSERYQIVKYAFLFQCYTGLSFVDLKNLHAENITSDANGRKWIRISRTKTDTASTIPLIPEAEAIINRYKGFTPLRCRIANPGYLIPVISNEQMNLVLKAFAGLINAPEKFLCTHTGRKTFATTALNSAGVSLETVSAMLGHANSRITSKYYAKVNIRKIEREMASFNFFNP